MSPKRRTRSATYQMQRSSENYQAACVAAPHTLHRPSENAVFGRVSFWVYRRVCRQSDARVLCHSKARGRLKIPSRVRGCATHPTQAV
ncbi:hypothetical protein [Kingella potus]|uniref:hypothetical protein n=1 Tax=Kingella potus TaxID=265175 RepID=UPI001FD41A55|nr:hypothetical protein [Kingella potus]UOO99904.1 hypothetical protein LVJ84_07455 [Kingella potus]